MITVLYIVSTLERCGPTNQLKGLISGLDRSVFKPIILTLSLEKPNSQLKDFEKFNVEIKTLGTSRLRLLLFGANAFEKMVSAIQPDVIHSCGLRPDIYVSRYLSDYPRISTVRCFIAKDYVMAYGGIIGKLAARKHIEALRRLEKVVGCSDSVKDYLKDNHNLPAFSIRNGIDNNHFFPIDKIQKIKLRNQLGIPEKACVFITTGHLMKRKDPLTTIKAFNMVLGNSENRLILVGDGELFESCRELSCEYVILPGKVNNVVDWLRASDIYVSSSLAEGIPNSVLEAMAVGLPVVLSDIKPHQEIFQVSGSIGDIFHAGDANDMARVLNEMINRNLVPFSKNAESAIRHIMSSTIMSKLYQRLYMEVTNSGIK